MTSNMYDYKAGVSNWRRAIDDLSEGWRRRRLWIDMALRGFRNNYRGAIMGGFWLTVTTAMTAIGLALLYGYLFGRPLEEHLPYVTIAFVVWSLITGFSNSGSAVFVTNAHIFKEFPLPLSLFIYRLVVLQSIAAFYRLIVLFAIILIFPKSFGWTSLLAILGLALIFWIGFWAAITLGIINARYRDFSQLVSAFLTFAFFLTPIFWLPERLGEYAVWVNINPFYHLIEVVRGPILGGGDIILHFVFTGALAAIAPLIGLYVFGKLSHRLPYWC
ncbi:MAG: ABC transporter permease [Pseudomonadota bacterium]